MSHADIRIGTLVPGNKKTPQYIRQIIPHGFESFEISFGQHISVDIKKVAADVVRVLEETPSPNGVQPVISALGVYGNPIEDKQTAKDMGALVDACKLFGPACKVVAGFAGCISGKPVPEAIKPWQKVFAPLAKKAEAKGLKIAFENCDMGGNWERPNFNIAHAPAAWELMFNAIDSKALGLEWEPCHQMGSLIDPMPQLRQWVKKVLHLHGKDASVDMHAVRTKGIRGGAWFCQHRHPGFGDCNWTDIISILRLGGFKGSIDVEGWHDPVYRNEMEMTGQVFALNHLKHCRGGAFVPNPVV